MSLQTDLHNAVTQVATDSALLHAVVHGGALETVSTEGGTVATLAKLLADADARINVAADGILAQTRQVADEAASHAGQAAQSLLGADSARQQAEEVLVDIVSRVVDANQAAAAAHASALDAADRRDETTVLRDAASLAATEAAHALADVPNAVRQTVDDAIAALPARMDPQRQLFKMKLIGLI
jgi:hypothetical protein